MADYAIHEETLLAQANILRKKFGTSDKQDPADYPAKMNLMGMLEEKTVSGSIVAFSDGADDVPLKSASFGIVASGGGGTPSAPISIAGASSVNVVHGGGNIFSSEWEQGSINTSGNNQTNSNVIRTVGFIRVFEGIHYSFTRDITTDIINFRGYDAEQNYIGSGSTILNLITGYSVTNPMRAGDSTCTIEIKSGSGVAYIRMNDYSNDLSVKYTMCVGDTPLSQYSPYVSTTHTENLGQTVYGGTLSSDGTLTITHKVYETSQDDSNWVTGYYSFGYRYYQTAPQGAKVGGCKSDISVVGAGDLRFSVDGDNRLNAYCTSESGYDTLAKFKQALGTGIKILYELATPIVITRLDEISISTYLGDNTLWSDGDLEVVYRSSGTQTLIPPTLISKTITANGTYSAEDDGADGYDEVTVSVQGGGGNAPQATQTLICDNSALGSTLTFTDDYSNYDLIKFVVYRSDVGNQFTFFMTPAMIDAMWQYSSNRINFNQPYGNNFVCYQKSSNTSWSRYGVRNMAVQYVYGLTFTNCTIAETELYNRQGIGSSNVTFTPPTGESFLDYDYILLATCTGNSDETQANLEIFQPNVEKDIFGSDNADENAVRVYKYNNGGTLVTITQNTITSFAYFYASGLKLSFSTQNLLNMNSSNSLNELDEELNEELNEEVESEEE